MRSWTASFLSLGLIWLALAGPESRAQDSRPTEYQIKAACIFHFAEFVRWPPSAFTASNSFMVIGILGENPFHDDLAQMLQNKTVDDHPLMVKEIRSLSEATNCHILFISSSEKARLPEILKNLKGTSVLTVSEMDHFTESGGMINFVLEKAKIRFEINNEAATSAGLKISSKLMLVAIQPQRNNPDAQRLAQ